MLGPALLRLFCLLLLLLLLHPIRFLRSAFCHPLPIRFAVEMTKLSEPFQDVKGIRMEMTIGRGDGAREQRFVQSSLRVDKERLNDDLVIEIGPESLIIFG